MISTSASAGRLPNPHPGEILLEDFLKPMQLSRSELARAVGVPPRRINEVVLGKRAVTAETDLLLAGYFGLSEGLFLRLNSPWQKSPLHSPGVASRLTSLLVGCIWPICALLTPCQAGATPVLVRRGAFRHGLLKERLTALRPRDAA